MANRPDTKVDELKEQWEAARERVARAEAYPTTVTVAWWEERDNARAAERRARTALIESGFEGKHHVIETIGPGLRRRLAIERWISESMMKFIEEREWGPEDREFVDSAVQHWQLTLKDLEEQVRELGL